MFLNQKRQHRESPRVFGAQSESVAVEFLEDKGYAILEQNYYARKLGEIDIIASKNKILHFIEVKSSKSDYDPIYNITPAKLRKVINSAHYYLKVKNLDIPFSIDAIIIRSDDIDYLENITL